MMNRIRKGLTAVCTALLISLSIVAVPNTAVQVKAAPVNLLKMTFNGAFKEAVSGKKMTNYGNIKFVKGKFGKCAYFDGDGDYLTLGKGFNLPKNYTFNVWVKAQSESRSDAAILAKYETNQYGPYDFYLSYNRPAFWISNGNGGSSELISSTKLDPDKWYMITFTYRYTQNKLSLYINGKLDNSWEVAPVTKNNDTVTIGRQKFMFGSYSDLEYEGFMDELSLYKGVLTKKQIQDLYKTNIL